MATPRIAAADRKQQQKITVGSLCVLRNETIDLSTGLVELADARTSITFANRSPAVGLESWILPLSPPAELKVISPYKQTGKRLLKLNRRSGPPFFATNRHVSSTTLASDGTTLSSIKRVSRYDTVRSR